jgi:hypothetical protein
MHGVHFGEQRVVEQHIGIHARQPGLDFTLERLDPLVRGRTDEMIKHALDPVERPPRPLQPENRRLEPRRRRLDRVEFGGPFGQRSLEGGTKMFEPDLGERRLAEGGGPGLKKRIVGQGGARVEVGTPA